MALASKKQKLDESDAGKAAAFIIPKALLPKNMAVRTVSVSPDLTVLPSSLSHQLLKNFVFVLVLMIVLMLFDCAGAHVRAGVVACVGVRGSVGVVNCC